MWQIGVKRGGLGLRSVERHAPLAYFASLRYAVQEVHGSKSTFLPPCLRDLHFNSSPFLRCPPSAAASQEAKWLRHFSAPLHSFLVFREAFARPVPEVQNANTLEQRIALCIHRIPEPRLQRYLSRTLDAEDAERIKALVSDPTHLRRMNDLGKPAMGLALYPAPAYLRSMAEAGRTGSSLLTNAQLYEALRLRLGLTLLSNSQGKCAICAKEVANADQHLMACMAGGIRTKCHNSVVDSISQLLVDLGFMVRTEVSLFADQKRMDIVVNVGGVRYALDAARSHPQLHDLPFRPLLPPKSRSTASCAKRSD
jgi:hypothetical protein